MHKTFLAAIAITLFAACLPASADSIENFTGFTNNLSPTPAGGDQGQVISASVGTSQGAATAIDGESVFVTIDTTAVNPIGSGSYGGGIITTIDDPFTAGEFTSNDPSDYAFVFDVAANGFAPDNVDIFLQFRNDTNDNQIGQLSINQNSAEFAPFITQLGASDNPVSVTLPLTAFSGTPADVTNLINTDRIQFQFFTRSLDANYSADAGNVLVLDNVGVTFAAQVPEPSSATLLVAGAIGLFCRRRRTA